MEPRLLNLEASRIRFLGEGNEHLVFSITHSYFVLRFRKTLLVEDTKRSEFLERTREELRYANNVARALVGFLVADEAQLIVVGRSVMEKLKEKLGNLRNDKRLNKTINPYGIGILTPNVATEFVVRENIYGSRNINILSIVQQEEQKVHNFTLYKTCYPVSCANAEAFQTDVACPVDRIRKIRKRSRKRKKSVPCSQSVPDNVLGTDVLESEIKANERPTETLYWSGENLLAIDKVVPPSTAASNNKQGTSLHMTIDGSLYSHSQGESLRTSTDGSLRFSRDSESPPTASFPPAEDAVSSSLVEESSFTAEAENTTAIKVVQSEGVLRCPSTEYSHSAASSYQFLTKETGAAELMDTKESTSDTEKTEEQTRGPNTQSERICIELKPKQGFLEPYSGGGLCRFCLKQYLKVRNRTEASRSSYCPLDLFSGDHILMTKALRGLFYSPQNNLRIFANGTLVADYNDYWHLNELIVQILLYTFEESKTQPTARTSDQPMATLLSTEVKESKESQSHIAESQVQESQSHIVESHSFSSESHYRISRSCDFTCHDHTISLHTAADAKDCKTYVQALISDNPAKKLRTNPNATNHKRRNNYRTNDTLNDDKVGCVPVKEKKQTGPAWSPSLFSFPPESLLPESSILGQVLKLQYMGGVSELQAALLYRELQRRFSCKDTLNKLLTNFSFLLNRDCTSGINLLQDLSSSISEEGHLPRQTSMAVGQEESRIWSGAIELLDSTHLVHLVQQALVAISCKDLSLMILLEGSLYISSSTTRSASPFWVEHPPKSGRWFKCQVSLVDLALKSPQKILEHEIAFNKLEEILSQLKKDGNEPSCCRTLTKERKTDG